MTPMSPADLELAQQHMSEMAQLNEPRDRVPHKAPDLSPWLLAQHIRYQGIYLQLLRDARIAEQAEKVA